MDDLEENLMTSDIEQRVNRARRADHWIYLDRSWAQRLGVKRTAGVYRIRGRELRRRLARERMGVDASGRVLSLGMPDPPRPDSSTPQERPRRSA